MSAREFTEWMAFSELCPLDPELPHWERAHISAMLFNVNKKRSAREMQPSDFLPWLKDFVRGGGDDWRVVQAQFAAMARRSRRNRADKRTAHSGKSGKAEGNADGEDGPVHKGTAEGEPKA